MRVLLAEDDRLISQALITALRKSGYAVDHASNGSEADTVLLCQQYDLLILDLGLPRLSGIEVLKRLRGRKNTMPVLVLTAQDGIEDRVRGLDAGADDYLTKPFGVGELNARIRAALRRAARPADSASPAYELTVDGRTLHVNVASRTVRISDDRGVHALRLTPTEFKLLAYLVKHAGRVLTHQQILKEVWGPTHARDVQYLRVYAAQLRQKVEATPAQPQFLLTEPGVGYRLATSSEHAG